MSKDYSILDELVPKTQELHRAIFDKGYEQGYQKALDAFAEKMKQSILESGDWTGNRNRNYQMVEGAKIFLQIIER